MKYQKDTDLEKFYSRKKCLIPGNEAPQDNNITHSKIKREFTTDLRDRSRQKGYRHIDYEDLQVVHDVIDKANNTTLKRLAKTQETKMKNLEDLIIKEKSKTDK